ncbi:helix-turn-helix domain-containing protein [Chloroflexota bacterium]
MPRKKYIINLEDNERQTLVDMTNKGTIKARKYKRAMILFKANESLRNPQIMVAVGVSRSAVERIRKSYLEGGLEKALNEDARPGQRRKLDGRGEAFLIATTCSDSPKGHDHWALRLLADRLVELGVVGSISYGTVHRTFKKYTEALAKGNVVHSESQRSIRCLHGRCA